MSRKAMQVALEALESDPISHAGLVTVLSPGEGTGLNYARASQKTAVSPDGGTGFIDVVWHEPEPTAWKCQCGKAYTVKCNPLYTAPPKRKWVGLTDEEVNELVARFKRYSYVLLREVELKLKEKNGG